MTKQDSTGGNRYQQMINARSLGEIIATAMSFEKSAHDFYAGLIERASEDIRPLVRELAEEEAEHYRQFEELSRKPDLEAYLEQQVAVPACEDRYAAFIESDKLAGEFDGVELLRYAIAREEAAMMQYLSLAEETEFAAASKLFRMFGCEELKHKLELEVRLHRMLQA